MRKIDDAWPVDPSGKRRITEVKNDRYFWAMWLKDERMMRRNGYFVKKIDGNWRVFRAVPKSA
jgi:hypothetical protein